MLTCLEPRVRLMSQAVPCLNQPAPYSGSAALPAAFWVQLVLWILLDASSPAEKPYTENISQLELVLPRSRGLFECAEWCLQLGSTEVHLSRFGFMSTHKVPNINTCINSYVKKMSCPRFAVNIVIRAEYTKPLWSHSNTGMFCSTHQLQQTSVFVHLMRTGEVEKILCYIKKNKVLEKCLKGEVLDKYDSSTDCA